MTRLHYRERPPAGDGDGLLLLHHGRGSDENDLLGLAEILDPARRLHVVSPRAPLTLPGWGGFHWYVVPRVGHPDPTTFRASYEALAELHDALWAQTGFGPGQTILGGFSMGAVMSYATGLGPDRPGPAGILALSGFIPTVDGWQPSTADRDGLRTFVGHGRNDPIIEVGFARGARQVLEDAGLALEYHESDAAHHVDPAGLREAAAWVEQTLPFSAPEAAGS